MFRRFLYSVQSASHCKLSWVSPFPGLVKTTVIDDKGCAFVVIYYEQLNEYRVISFDLLTGKTIWSQSLINGGYGAPALSSELVIVPFKFTAICALSKKNGEEKWRIETESRVRSPVNVIDECIYFSAGGAIYSLSDRGEVKQQWTLPGAFFYGGLDKAEGLLLSLGAAQSDSGTSEASVYAFTEDGSLAYQLPIARSTVVSSDTAGIAVRDGYGYVGSTDLIGCFCISSGEWRWKVNVTGFAGREVCAVGEDAVYFTARGGLVGALNRRTGEHLWTFYTRDTSLASPISIAGDTLLILYNAHLNIHRAVDGQFLDAIPIGHSPYSIASIWQDRLVVGCGEPPHHGLLMGFELSTSINKSLLVAHSTLSGAFVESDYFDLSLYFSGPIHDLVSVDLNASIFGSSSCLTGMRIGVGKYVFRIPIEHTMSPGDYVIPVTCHLVGHQYRVVTVLIRLERKYALPRQAHLQNIPDIQQDGPLYSGAAIASAVRSMYGDDRLNQAAARKMVEKVLERSGYEPFQIWRIVLRRVLTTQAHSAAELPEFVPVAHDDSR